MSDLETVVGELWEGQVVLLATDTVYSIAVVPRR